jgi:hypothetical protein
MAKLLESPNKEVRNWTHYTLGELARHGTTAMAAAVRLVPLLQWV